MWRLCSACSQSNLPSCIARNNFISIWIPILWLFIRSSVLLFLAVVDATAATPAAVIILSFSFSIRLPFVKRVLLLFIPTVDTAVYKCRTQYLNSIESDSWMRTHAQWRLHSQTNAHRHSTFAIETGILYRVELLLPSSSFVESIHFQCSALGNSLPIIFMPISFHYCYDSMLRYTLN